jgi:hypothetical protein
MTKDDDVEQVRRVREELINRHGGIEGYFRYCQALDRRWSASAKRRDGKKPGAQSRKTTRAR